MAADGRLGAAPDRRLGAAADRARATPGAVAAARTMPAMDATEMPWVSALAGLGIAAGLWLLVRGMGGYRTAARIGDTSTSLIGSIAAGEVRLSGVIEAAEATLVSPLQSVPCVYYHSTAQGDDGLTDAMADFSEERAVGFRVRDATGSIRVFPRGARWDAPVCFDDATSTMGDEPPGLDLRTGSAIAGVEVDRAAAIAALLTVHPGDDDDIHPRLRGMSSGRGRHYTERRLAVGDAITVVGRAMPFGDLADPAEADVAIGADLGADDPEVAANIAEARAAGILVADPEDAWGNAAIPGFGIGRPTRPPDLDPEADRPVLGPAADEARAARRFTIDPETLVLASAPDVPLLIAYGVPGAAVERQQHRFVIGLLGAVMAIASALALAVSLSSLAGTTP